MQRRTSLARSASKGALGAALTLTAVLFAANMAAAPPEDPFARTVDAADSRAMRLSVIVDLSKRQLDVRIGGALEGTYDVAVGQAGHRTPTGAYALSRVVWNPDWVPPDSEWAEEAERAAPEDPDNPMGDVKIYFTDLLYIHGTDATDTLGEPASHGCIRMRNEDAKALARLVMEHGGDPRPEDWYDRAAQNDRDQHVVQIPEPPTLRVTD